MMRRKGSACALLVGMQISAATLENSMEVPQKTCTLLEHPSPQDWMFIMPCRTGLGPRQICRSSLISCWVMSSRWEITL